MPAILRVNGYRFFFFSIDVNEPMHVHVEKGEKYAKFWIKPICLAYNYKFISSELGKIMDIIEEHKAKIEEKWNEHFSI